MSVSVTMPRLGESVTEGTVTRWLKKEGDRVEADEPLLEVSTDKVDTEIPAPAAGVLTSIRVAEDETVEVGAELAVIDDGERRRRWRRRRAGRQPAGPRRRPPATAASAPAARRAAAAGASATRPSRATAGRARGGQSEAAEPEAAGPAGRPSAPGGERRWCCRRSARA